MECKWNNRVAIWTNYNANIWEWWNRHTHTHTHTHTLTLTHSHSHTHTHTHIERNSEKRLYWFFAATILASKCRVIFMRKYFPFTIRLASSRLTKIIFDWLPYLCACVLVSLVSLWYVKTKLSVHACNTLERLEETFYISYYMQLWVAFDFTWKRVTFRALVLLSVSHTHTLCYSVQPFNIVYTLASFDYEVNSLTTHTHKHTCPKYI